MSSGSRGRLGAGVAALRVDLERVAVGDFLIPPVDWFRGALSGPGIVVGVAGVGMIPLLYPPRLVVFGRWIVPGLLMVEGGVGGAPVPRLGVPVTLGGIVIFVDYTEMNKLVVCKAVSGDQASLRGRASIKVKGTKENGMGHFCLQIPCYTGKLYG